MIYLLALTFGLSGFLIGFAFHFIKTKFDSMNAYLKGYKDGMNEEFRIILDIMKKHTNDK